jgi:membrane associated rhomboid family serine protease
VWPTNNSCGLKLALLSASTIAMGVYDRDYYRNDVPRPGIASWSAVTTLIVINVLIFIADQFSPALDRAGSVRWLDEHMALLSDVYRRPWQAWQLLTYGFAHDPATIMHILGNMFGLWLFGRDVETIYGKKQFYQLYLSLIVLSGLAWVVIQKIAWPRELGATIGASGAVMGVIMVYIFHFPHRTFLFMFAIPMPAWVLGILYVYFDLSGALGGWQLTNEHVNNVAHLAGAAFGILFYQTRWTLFSIWPGNWLKSVKRRRSGYRVYRGDRDGDRSDPRQLQQQVDDILAKISREGEASLTPDERRTLEEASRKYRGDGGSGGAP